MSGLDTRARREFLILSAAGAAILLHLAIQGFGLDDGLVFKAIAVVAFSCSVGLTVGTLFSRTG